MTSRATARNRVFVSYSHADVRWLRRLRVHMKPLIRDEQVEWFDDSEIAPGANWRDEISRALAATKVAVLLISADFLASDFVADDEIPPLLKAAEEKGAVILPLIVSPSRFKEISSLARFQPINPPSKPLAALKKSEQERIFDQAAQAVLRALAPAPRADHSGTRRKRTAASAAPLQPTRSRTASTRAILHAIDVSPTSIDFGSVTGPEEGHRQISVHVRRASTETETIFVSHSEDGDWFNVLPSGWRIGHSQTYDVVIQGRTGQHTGTIVFRSGQDQRSVPVSATVEVPGTASATELYATAARDFDMSAADHAFLWRMSARLEPDEQIQAAWLVPRHGLLVATGSRLVFVFGNPDKDPTTDAIRYADLKFTLRRYKGGQEPILALVAKNRNVELRGVPPASVHDHLRKTFGFFGPFGLDEVLGPMDLPEVEAVMPGILDEATASRPFAIRRCEAYVTQEAFMSAAIEAMNDKGATLESATDSGLVATKGKTRFHLHVTPRKSIFKTVLIAQEPSEVLPGSMLGRETCVVTLAATWNGLRVMARTRQELQDLGRRLLERGVDFSFTE